MQEMDKDALNLNNMAIASPCTASWDEMTGDDRVRHCSLCTKNVYNLSLMSRREAETLIAEKEGRLCVRFYRRADGTVLTDDCPVGLRAVRAGYRKLATAAASFLALLFSVGAAFAGTDKDTASKAEPKCVKQPESHMGGAAARRPVMGEADVPMMGSPAPLPAVTKGEAWIPKFQKSVESNLKTKLGSKVSAPLVQFYMTIGQDGSVVSFTTDGNSVSEEDRKALEAVRQMKFKEFPKETKLKQVNLHIGLAHSKAK